MNGHCNWSIYRWLQGWFIVIYCTVLLSTAAAKPDQNLLHHAIVAISVRQWIYRRDSTCDYFWLSDHEALFFRQADYTLIRYDLHRHKATPLRSLTKQLNATLGAPWTIVVSPNGQRLLWVGGGDKDVDGNLNSETQAIYIGSVDGSHLIRTPTLNDTPFLFWVGDSRHWIRLVVGDRGYEEALVYSVNIPRPIQDLPVSGNSLLNRDNFTATRDAVMTLDGVVLSTHCMVVPTWGENRTSMDILEADLTAKGRIIRRFVLRFPQRAENLERAISDRGDRVAVLLALRRGTMERISLCVGKIENGALHEVGNVVLTSLRRGSRHPINPEPNSLKWLPDDHHVSFVYRGMLYVFPV